MIKKNFFSPVCLEDVVLVSEGQGKRTRGDLTKRFIKIVFICSYMNNVWSAYQ